MKIAVLAALALAVSCLQVNGQDAEDKFKFRTKELTKKRMTAAEIKAYAKNPKNKPTIDYPPTGKNAQPSTAGVSKTEKVGKGVKKQIIGGTAATLKQFPWQVYLSVSSNGGGWLCGGSLISAEWVLTAAHCVLGATRINVTAGGINRNTAEIYEKSQISTTFIYHENYDDNIIINDIAVIALPAPFELNEYINVVKLPTQADVDTTYEGTKAIASGYGVSGTKKNSRTSQILMYVQLTVISNAQCVSYYGDTVLSSNVCTLDTTKNICGGDSGGPLMNVANGIYKQFGIVSFGARNCVGTPSGYARVTSFLGWISEKTNILIL